VSLLDRRGKSARASQPCIRHQGRKVVFINKDREQRILAELVLPTGVREFRTYTLAHSLGRRLLERSVSADGNNVRLSLEPYSATLIVSR
jgi:hypothetical protein